MTSNPPHSSAAHPALHERPGRTDNPRPATEMSIPRPAGMRIVVVGAGYVGLVSAACFAELGHQVAAVDTDPARVSALSSGQVPFFEPGLQALVTTQRAHGRLRFTADLAEVVASAELVFIAVGTPPREDGSADLSAVESALDAITRAARGPLTVVLKSTVPVGTHHRLSRSLPRHGVGGHRLVLLNNPEFLREGSAVDDFLGPDRILVGATRTEDAQPLLRAYDRLLEKGVPMLCMSPASAELGKYASNAMLAARISFMNEMSQIAEATGADIEEVRRVVGSDRRIGHDFLRAGMGYGGSCFPKDVRALTHTARCHGLAAPMLRGVEQANERQKQVLFDRMARHYGGVHRLRGKSIALWGLAFKPGTDDLREAPSLVLLQALCEAGARVSACDPVAARAAERLLGHRAAIHWCDDAMAALEGADALVVATEWDEFRVFPPSQVFEALADKVVFDGRNCLPSEAWRLAGLQVVQIGRPVKAPPSGPVHLEHAAAGRSGSPGALARPVPHPGPWVTEGEERRGVPLQS